MLLENHIKTNIPNANESQTERHIQNSNPDSPIDLEPASQESRGPRSELKPETSRAPEGAFPLGMVLDACPDIVDYSKGGIANWRDFEVAAAAVVRPMLGISPSAWEEAQTVMGERQAAIVVAAILQRGAAIHSGGAYLRGLTRKAEAHEFSLGPMLMALIGSRKRDKKRA
jgi:replication initiation protein RepC